MGKASFHAPAEAHLRDESGLRGAAGSAVLPRTAEELEDAVRAVGASGERVTVQGGRTGMCGGAVPDGGVVIDLSRMDAVTGFAFDPDNGQAAVAVEPGLTLGRLTEILREKTMDTSRLDPAAAAAWRRYQASGMLLEFTVNPTEPSATLGGMAATNAYGSRAWRSGDMRANILGLSVVMPGGLIMTADNAAAAGAPARDGPGCRGDLGVADLLCGSEGRAGVIAGLVLHLVRARPHRWGLLAFFNSPAALPRFYSAFVESPVAVPRAETLGMELFDRACMDLARRQRERVASLKILPAFPEEAGMAVWLDICGDDEDALMAAYGHAVDCLESAGESPDLAIAATEGRDFARLSSFRHVLTETANMLCPVLPGLCVDLAIDSRAVPEVVRTLHSRLEACDCPGIIMGHLAGGQITLRLLPGEPDPGEAAVSHISMALPELRALECRCGMAHGVGKAKKQAFAILNPGAYAETRRALLTADPTGRWNPGTLCD